MERGWGQWVNLHPRHLTSVKIFHTDSRCRWQMWPLTGRKSSETQLELQTWKDPKVRTLNMSPRLKLLNKTSPKMFPCKGSLNVRYMVFSRIFSHLYKTAEGCLDGSVGWASDSWFGSGHDLSVCEIQPCIGLHAEHGTCLGFSLSPSVPPLLLLGLSQKIKIKKWTKNKK